MAHAWLACGSRELFEHVHVEALHAVRVEVVELGLLLRLRLQPLGDLELGVWQEQHLRQ